MTKKHQNIILVCGVILLFGCIPFILSPYYVTLVIRALILAILAMSVNFLLGYLGLASVGHSAFFGVSAYAVAIISRHTGGLAWTAIALGLLTSVLVGALFGFLVVRTKDIFFLVTMLAFSQLLYGLAYGWKSVTGGDDGLPGLARPEILPGFRLDDTVHYYFFVVGIFLLLMAGVWLLVNSPFTLTLKGIRDSESRMKALGYRVWLYKHLAFVISALIGGLSGVLNAYFDGCPSPRDFSVIRSSTALLMVILGSPGTLAGPVIGSFIIVFLEDFISGIMERWVLVLGAIYVFVVLAFPDGLLKALRKHKPYQE